MMESKIEWKPSADQVAWVFSHIVNHINEGGTYRYLIYDRMYFEPKDYDTLLAGMAISNFICEGQMALEILRRQYDRVQESKDFTEWLMDLHEETLLTKVDIYGDPLYKCSECGNPYSPSFNSVKRANGYVTKNFCYHCNKDTEIGLIK